MGVASSHRTTEERFMHKEEEREREREGGGGREGGRKGEREGGRERGREGKERGREREGGRGEREVTPHPKHHCGRPAANMASIKLAMAGNSDVELSGLVAIEIRHATDVLCVYSA